MIWTKASLSRGDKDQAQLQEDNERENSQRMLQLYQKLYLNNLARIQSLPREALTMTKSLTNMKKMKQGDEEYTNLKCQRDWKSG